MEDEIVDMKLERIAAKIAGRYKVTPRTKVETVERVLKSLGIRNAELIANKIVRMQGDVEEVMSRLEIQFGIPIDDDVVEGPFGSVNLREIRRYIINNDLESVRNIAKRSQRELQEEYGAPAI